MASGRLMRGGEKGDEERGVEGVMGEGSGRGML